MDGGAGEFPRPVGPDGLLKANMFLDPSENFDDARPGVADAVGLEPPLNEKGVELVGAAAGAAAEPPPAPKTNGVEPPALVVDGAGGAAEKLNPPVAGAAVVAALLPEAKGFRILWSPPAVKVKPEPPDNPLPNITGVLDGCELPN